MVEEESVALQQQTKAELERSGNNSSVELPLSVFEEQAKRRVKLGLLVGEVVKNDELKLDEEKFEETLTDLAQSYENPEEIKEMYRQEGEQKQALANMVLENQVVDMIMDKVKTEDEPSSFDALLSPDN
jgi:trigger factor